MVDTLTRFGTRYPHLFDEFRREVDTLMNRFFEEGDAAGTRYTPLANVCEEDNSYEVTLDLPGMKLEDLNVEFKHGDLWITGERKSEVDEEKRTYHRIERPAGRFQRVIHLGQDVDPENVEAEYKDGVLWVTVPKTEEAATKHIEIKG